MRVRQTIDSVLTLQNSLILIAFLALCLIKVADFCNDPGLGWHLATGKYISENNSLPTKDPFLFAEVKNNWVADQWLADLLFFQIKELGDWPLLYALLIVLYVAGFVLIPLYTQNKLSGRYLYLTAPLVIIFSFLLGSIHFICRPVILSFFCFSLLFNFLLWKIERQQYSFSLKEYVFLGINFLFWANFHPSFILGFFLLLLFALQDYCLKSSESLPRLGLPLGLAFFASLLNPAFFALHESILFLGSSNFATKYYLEWQPVTATDDLFIYLVLPLIVYLLALLFRKVKLSARETFTTLSFLVFCLASLKAVRFMPYYGICLIPVISQILGQIFDRVSVLRRSLQILEAREQKGLNPLMVYLLVSILLFGASFSGRLPFFSGTFGPNPQIFPIEAVEKLKTYAQNPGLPLRVLNEVNFGGYITYAGEGKIQAYIDDRTSLFRDEFYFHYLKNFKSENIFILARLLKADFILLQNSALDADLINFLKIKHAESVVYADDRSLLFKLN